MLVESTDPLWELKSSTLSFHHCQTPNGRFESDKEPLLKRQQLTLKSGATDQKLGLIAVLSACQNNDCSAPFDFIEKHRITSARQLVPDVKSIVDNFVKSSGQKVVLNEGAALKRPKAATNAAVATTGGTAGANDGCSDPQTGQKFTDRMFGCKGKTDFTNRGSLCNIKQGWSPCPSWVWVNYAKDKSGNPVKPEADYWLKERVGKGDIRKVPSGSANNVDCLVSNHPSFSTSCQKLNAATYPTGSFLVCADNSGNCMQKGCGIWPQADKAHGLDGSPILEDLSFGGCAEEAGTLCCR
jgi:hypothetical protein